MRTLIVATDFSKEAENALEYAGALASKLQAQIILLNSFSLPIHAANTHLPASAYQEIIEQNKRSLQQRAAKLSEKYSIKAGYELGMMDLIHELDTLKAKYPVNIVIMGMAAKSIEQDLFGNSTTAAIMKFRYPVLAIPYDSKFEGIKKILFACDELQDESVLSKIKQLASVLEAEVEIFRVSKHLDMLQEQPSFADAPVIDEALGNIPHHYKNVESNKVISAIEHEVKQINADLLIMVPRKYGFLESLVHRSKTRIMATNNNVPLLSIPMEN